MNILEEKKIYSIKLTQVESRLIYKFLTVSSYDRLYDTYITYRKKITDEDLAMQGAGKKLHFIQSVNRLKEEDGITDSIMMNQLALGLLLEYCVKYLVNQKEGEIRDFKLNPLLTYEFYITVCERIIFEENKYKTFSDNQSDLQDKKLCKTRIKLLQNISEKIKNSISMKNLSLMEVEYEKISLEKHLDLCLQEP